jgi:hypothetical protein
MQKPNLRNSPYNRWFQSCTCSILGLAIGITLLAGGAAGDTVTSVSCATPTASFVTGPASCNVLGSYGFSQASVNSGIVLPATAGDAAVINASSSVSALQTGIHGITATATAQSSADIGIIFDTSGAVRNGYLELSFLQNAWEIPENGAISESLTIGSYTASPDGASLSSIWIPIQLGTQFGFNYLESVAAIGSSGSGLTVGEIDSEISLLAFESDGTTAVQLFDPPGDPGSLTPEPSSAGIVIAGILGLAVLLKFRH